MLLLVNWCEHLCCQKLIVWICYAAIWFITFRVLVGNLVSATLKALLGSTTIFFIDGNLFFGCNVMSLILSCFWAFWSRVERR